MIFQFFAKPFWITLGLLAAVFIVAIFIFNTSLTPFALILIGLISFLITLKNLHFGILIAFAELFANSHGHLIFTEISGIQIGLRMTIFISVMLAWFILFLIRKVNFSFKDQRLIPFLILAAAILLGFITGLLQNTNTDVFADGNAYLYIAYIFPILSVHWDATKQRLLLQVLAAAAIWVTILTLGLLYVFTHFPEWMLVETYRFIRDTRTGELTKMAGNIFRVFLQAQFYVLIFLFFLAPFFYIKSKGIKWWKLLLIFSLAISVVLVSLSRSFWLGLAISGVVLFILVIRFLKPKTKQFSKAIGSKLLTVIIAALFLIGIVAFPYPYQTGSLSGLSELFSSRTTDLDDAAISSRWQLLEPMQQKIMQNPILGSGFGTKVAFITDDPRVRAINPDGKWETYALEWGWLDLWIKMGILGPIAFIFLFVAFVKGLRSYLIGDKKWLGIAMVTSLVFLYVIHIFSPYLNHPLGLGLLLLMVPFLQSKKTAEAIEEPIKNEFKKAVPQPTMLSKIE